MGLVIFDLDGTLTPQRPASTSPFIQQFIAGVEERCRELIAAGHTLAVASNQGGIARGLAVEIVEEHMVWVSGRLGISAHRYCWDDARRKPSPAMLLELMEHFCVSRDETWMVGDSEADEQAAEAAGVRFVHASAFAERGLNPKTA